MRVLSENGELELSAWGKGWLDYQVGKCRNKVTYNSKGEAEKRAKFYTEKYGSTATAYNCPFCGKWHVTTHRWEEGNG